MNVSRNLKVNAESARVLMLNLRDILADDETAKSDAIEGETSLMEAIDVAVARLGELDCHKDALKAHIDALKSRLARFENQGEMIRAALASAIGMSGLRKIERPSATLSLRAVAASVRVIEEADIPSAFWKPQAPKLDKSSLLKALKEGPVAGAELSNGGETIAIRWM